MCPFWQWWWLHGSRLLCETRSPGEGNVWLAIKCATKWWGASYLGFLWLRKQSRSSNNRRVVGLSCTHVKVPLGKTWNFEWLLVLRAAPCIVAPCHRCEWEVKCKVPFSNALDECDLSFIPFLFWFYCHPLTSRNIINIIKGYYLCKTNPEKADPEILKICLYHVLSMSW